MNYNILAVPQFKKDIKKLAKRYKAVKQDLLKLIEELEVNPTQGTALGNNLYKIRLANSSVPTGKSGGFRVITYCVDDENNLYLLSIYSKTDRDNISDAELKEILESME